MNACIKCGNVDAKNKISMVYHRGDHHCPYKSNSTKEIEHLHFTCQLCGYDWCASCVSSSASLRVGSKVWRVGLKVFGLSVGLSVDKEKKVRK